MSDSNTPQAASSDHDPDESRVYFGPFKSPEKKYISAGLAASTQPMDSPSRRSPRLSSPMPVPNPSAEPADEDEGDNAFEEDEDDLSLSRSGTPDNDRWQQDEPSSVLASRITRAHDNPSPPPGPPVLDLESGPRTPDRYPLHPIPFITPHSPSPSSRDGSPSPRPPPSPQNTTQPDLISFDSFSTSVNPLPTQPVASTSSIYPPPHAPSVDELLSTWSPSARDTPAVTISPPPNEKGGEYPKGKARMRESSTPEAAEEQAVANALIYSDVFELPASPQSFQGVTNSVEPYASDDEAPRTPVRRSTRPRRSGTPHAHLVPIPSSDEEDSPARTLLEPSKAFTKKKRKNGKEREISAGTMSIDSGEGSAVSDVPLLEEDREVKKRRERGERKQALGGTPQALLQRQLGSLSPGSANVLTQLLTTSRPSPVREQEEPQQPPYPFSVFPAAHTTPARATSPMRASPARKATPRSPNRIQFQTPHLNDPNRTPARRIPVEQAVARGQISPQKGAQLLTNNLDAGPVSRTPVFHIPSQDTPARRVVAPPSEVQSKWQGTRSGSPTRGKLKERTGSAEPRTPWNATVNTGSSSDIGASASKSRPSPSRTISAPIKKGKLPFPLAPPASDRPAPIPEDKPLLLTAHLPENTATPASSTLLGIIKIPRSTLRQPTSRIPRIGTKPYARPAVQPASDKGGKAPASAPLKVVETLRLPTSRTVKVSRAESRSNSYDMKTAEAGPSSLKRKRVPSPQNKLRPVVLLRQVAATKHAPKALPVQTAPSPVKKPSVAKFRMVDLHARPTVDAAELELPDDAIQAESVPDALDDLRPPSLSSPVIPTPEDVIPTSQPDPHPPSSPTSEPGSLRRTTRLRKSLFPASAGSTQPLPTRRKVSRQEPPSSGAFAGMTAVALKALTSSNTNRNQKYLAAKLETEVVRRDGARPESPAVKIRTIAQREQEERSTQRKARAARRARRSDDGLSETEGLSDIGNSSAMDLYSDDVDSSPVRRHRRGPGDEEDYETPKVGRSAKRPSSHSPSNEEGQVGKKRVKWHRGLSTAVFLDEVEPGTKARPKENVVKKGCLAPTAKALQLDPLGNHLNAESPLKDLVEENIVVKKFVYENDDEPVQPAVAVKNTRSKAKKKS